MTKRIRTRWNPDLVRNIAVRCADRRDFRLTFPAAYAYASRKALLPSIYAETRLPHAAGTLERLMGEAS
jgi:hypothetical protein